MKLEENRCKASGGLNREPDGRPAGPIGEQQPWTVCPRGLSQRKWNKAFGKWLAVFFADVFCLHSFLSFLHVWPASHGYKHFGNVWNMGFDGKPWTKVFLDMQNSCGFSGSTKSCEAFRLRGLAGPKRCVFFCNFRWWWNKILKMSSSQNTVYLYMQGMKSYPLIFGEYFISHDITSRHWPTRISWFM